MSFKRSGLFPANPITNRGTATKLSATKGKVVYANGKTVIIRDLNNPLLSTTYTGHVHNATVARFSHSGYYCASADVNGTVRIWDTVGEDQTLKGEYRVISGRINDLEWDGENKRIIAVGEGRDKLAHAFTFDSGNAVGEIGGHSKNINAVAIRHQRPFRAATASDDNTIVFHQGVPFKFDKSIKTHTKFVQDVRYAPSGDHFASVGSDSKIFLYDGKTGDTVASPEDYHKGSIMACNWSPDSKSLVTSSADCTVVLWDVETRKPTTTWKVGTGVDHQQMGNTWCEENIVSLSMSGDLNVFDPRVGDKPTKVLNGSQKVVNALASSGSDTFLSGSADGRILSYSPTTGESAPLTGAGHTNWVSGLTTASESSVFSIGWDDRVKEIQVTDTTPQFTSTSLATAAQPRSIATTEDSTVFVAEIETIEAFKAGKSVFKEKPKYAPSAVAALGGLVAVGAEDSKVYLREWTGSALTDVGVLEGSKGVVSSLAFSPDGNLLAAGDSTGRIALFNVKEKTLVTSRWSFHTARVHSLSWTADSKHCASASLDTHVYVWSVAKPMKNIAIKNAVMGGANAVLWYDKQRPERLAVSGADGCVKLYEITFHA